MERHVVWVSLTLALLAGCSEKKEPNVQQLPANIADGKAVAEKSCSRCHGMDGRGVSDGIPNLAAQNEAYLLKAAKTYDHGKRTGSGGNAMVITKDLAPDQLRNVIGYYASLPPLGNPGSADASYSYYDRGAELSKPCSRCHGVDGNPAVAGVPRLAGQHPQYIVKATKAYQDGTRVMPTMHEKLTGLSLADMENMAIYFALNKPKPATGKPAKSYEGKQYINSCAKCHGSMGSSDDASIPNLAGQDAKYLSTTIKAYRDHVRSHGVMHEMIAGLKDSEADKIAALFASEQPSQIAFIPPETPAALAQKCDLCHGPGNTNPDMVAPKLNGQNRAYLISALTAYRDDNRGSSTMHSMSTPLYFNATIEGIAAYYSAQAPK
jgi:cytochrome c553